MYPVSTLKYVPKTIRFEFMVWFAETYRMHRYVQACGPVEGYIVRVGVFLPAFVAAVFC